MATVENSLKPTDCDVKLFEHFLDALETTLKAIREFNSSFTEFIDEHKKTAKDLWNWVTRYNILDA